MGSLDIFIDNINKIAESNHLFTYNEIAKHLKISIGSLKQWECKSRSPSLKKLDQISNAIGCHTYLLIQKNADFTITIKHVNNSSRDILIENLQEIFINNGRFTWRDRAALFYEFVSEDALKSYFRNQNYKTPPLKKLDDMAEALGIPTYRLLKENGLDEETDK